MITRDNLKWCFDTLEEADIKQAFEANEDFILFEIHIFNVGSFPSLKCYDWTEDTAQTAEENGDIFCDKDTFLELAKEADTENSFLTELF